MSIAGRGRVAARPRHGSSGAIIRFLSTSLLLVALGGEMAVAQQSAYVNARECAACHSKTYASYRLTGMGRSFYRATPGASVADFYHAASDTHYSMLQRDGGYYQRRWQIGPDGKETNVEEMKADFVMGSGNHARTYLHRTTRGTLMELPLGWYAEKGGYWAMNPGYDTLHPPSHRPVTYECMFCHNSYPAIPAGQEEPGSEPSYAGNLPEGIDCQRCHGPGAKHVRLALGGTAKAQDIRAAIVNPARLNKERQMEVCLQCHLETASTRLPSLVRRFGRGPFSYIPGQPLGDFVLSFDHAAGAGYDDKFEIAGSAYRFRQSKCFLASKGEMTCETCHDPHNIPRGAPAAAYYASICRGCHAGSVDRLTASGSHPSSADCIGCHMPKRRTDDVVHAVMTDHLIQRRVPSRDLLAELSERHPAPAEEYRGEVAPYYPSPLPPSPDNALYLALAQVQHGSNLVPGIARLTAALAAAKPRPDFYMALGDAWHLAGDPAKAAQAYEQAARLQPASARAARYLGTALRESGEPARAAEILQRALRLSPADAQSWFELGLIASDVGRTADAIAALRNAIACDPDLPDVYNSLAVNQVARGDAAAAEKAFREALRIDPYYQTAHANLARLLADQNDFQQAVYHFEKAARLHPADAANLYEYALALVRMNRFDDSREQVLAALRADSNLAEAHELLGGLLAREKDMDSALREYREAVRLKPAFGRAQLDLAATLAAKGEMGEAVLHFREAARSGDPRIADQAARALREIGGGQ